MRTTYIAILSLLLASTVFAAEDKPAAPAAASCSQSCAKSCSQSCAKGCAAACAKSGCLTPKEISDGTVMLFDCATTFGWKIEGDAKVDGCKLAIGGEKDTLAQTTTAFGSFELSFMYTSENAKGVQLILNGEPYDLQAPADAKTPAQAKFKVESQDKTHTVKAAFGKVGGELTAKGEAVKQAGPSHTTVGFRVPAGSKLAICCVKLQPADLKPIFNGKDLTGWTPIEGHASKFTVENGQINIKDGNGDLQSAWQGDDFVLQLEGISRGKHLNSGVFFRALPGQFWQGYEAQVRNEWDGYSKDEKRNAQPEDRTKPVDYGTGGVYNRQPTRKVVSSDGEWFTMTVVADGKHIATWVNGYQCADYVDNDPDAETARKGRYLGKGCITLQGHDPTTDLSFKNIRVADLPKKGDSK